MVEDGRVTKWTPTLRQNRVASIILRSDPPGANVTLDGRDMGTTPYVSTLLPPGKHVFELTAPRHRPHEVIMEVKGGGSFERTVDLVSNYGTLRVESEPSGASYPAQRGKDPVHHPTHI